MEFSIRPFVVLYGPAGEAMQVFHRFTSLFSYCSFLLIKMQPTDLVVAGCGVCMMLPGTILPPGMGVPFFIGVILRLYSVSDGTFPARRFTVSSRQAMLRWVRNATLSLHSARRCSSCYSFCPVDPVANC